MRKVYYNITVTGLSVVVAFRIGTVELLQVASARLQLSGGAWAGLDARDFELLGYAVIGTFVATWAISLAVWKLHRVEERWRANLEPDSAKGAVR